VLSDEHKKIDLQKWGQEMKKDLEILERQKAQLLQERQSEATSLGHPAT